MISLRYVTDSGDGSRISEFEMIVSSKGDDAVENSDILEIRYLLYKIYGMFDKIYGHHKDKYEECDRKLIDRIRNGIILDNDKRFTRLSGKVEISTQIDIPLARSDGSWLKDSRLAKMFSNELIELPILLDEIKKRVRRRKVGLISILGMKK
jgi:hypothetical protein